MVERKSLGWHDLQRLSASERKRLDQLISRSETLIADASRDCITGSSVLTTEISRWQESISGFETRIRRVLDSLGTDTKTRLEEFDRFLARELTKRGHTVHGDSPLIIVDGIVHIEIDLSKLIVSVNGVKIPDLAIPLITARVEGEIDRIRKDLTEPSALIGMLALAYDRDIRATEKQPGAQAETTSILFQVAMLRQSVSFRSNPQAKNFRDYPRDLFRADLYTLLASGQLIAGSRKLHFAAGADTSGAIFMMVPPLGRPAHVGRLWFEAASA